MKVSVICPIYNEEKFIARCIETMLSQDFPCDEMELLFIDGMSKDRTREIVAGYAERYENVHLLDNPQKIVPYALNTGIRAARGEYVIRIDGHCSYPTNYVSTLIHWAEKLKADNVGALLNTLPANDSPECQAIAIVMSHRFGVGNSLCRVGVDEVTKADTVPFGCFHRSVFERVGMFDTELVRNQDDEFNARIINHGGQIYLIPDLSLDYYARDSAGKLMKMYYQYGLFKPLVNKKLGSPATVRQFFPMAFVIGIVLGGLLSFLTSWAIYPYIAVLLLYILLAFGFAAYEAQQRKVWQLLGWLPLMFFLIHISYGWGYLVGIYKLLVGQKFSVEVNR